MARRDDARTKFVAATYITNIYDTGLEVSYPLIEMITARHEINAASRFHVEATRAFVSFSTLARGSSVVSAKLRRRFFSRLAEARHATVSPGKSMQAYRLKKSQAHSIRLHHATRWPLSAARRTPAMRRHCRLCLLLALFYFSRHYSTGRFGISIVAG